jgi:gamma-glutamylcyclotransferase (GGCT)/AIG2-like uncharacterized protein YtfP
MSNPASHTLFVYGTLMIPEVLTILLGRVPVMHEALLRGYRRYTIDGACYPAIISDTTANVNGQVLLGLTPREVATLDDYEGDAYVRTEVTLTVDGASTSAECYVWRDASRVRLGRDDWDLETFVCRHLEQYLRGLS